MYSSKVRLQYIKISAWLHMIEAQERHEKSPKKMTSTHARCGSSGGTPYMNQVEMGCERITQYPIVIVQWKKEEAQRLKYPTPCNTLWPLYRVWCFKSPLRAPGVPAHHGCPGGGPGAGVGGVIVIPGASQTMVLRCGWGRRRGRCCNSNISSWWYDDTK